MSCVTLDRHLKGIHCVSLMTLFINVKPVPFWHSHPYFDPFSLHKVDILILQYWHLKVGGGGERKWRHVLHLST